MGINNAKIWTCVCDECGDIYEDLAVERSDFIIILKSEQWELTFDGNKAVCPKCQENRI